MPRRADTVTFTGIDAGEAVCGDGVVQSGEQCDDGNAVAGDGCTACMTDAVGECADGDRDCPSANDDGCGCSSSPDASGVGLFALMMGALLAPRRRRLARRRAA